MHVIELVTGCRHNTRNIPGDVIINYKVCASISCFLLEFSMTHSLSCARWWQNLLRVRNWHEALMEMAQTPESAPVCLAAHCV